MKTNESGHQFLIRLPQEVYDSLLDDAQRCRRSKTKQVEAILVTYYQLENVELSPVDDARNLVSPGLDPMLAQHVTQSGLFSEGMNKSKGKRESRAVKRDKEEMKRIAREHTDREIDESE